MLRLLAASCVTVVATTMSSASMATACGTLYVEVPIHTEDATNSQVVIYSDGDANLGLGSADLDNLGVELYTINHPFMSGTFDLGSGSDSNYATCDECILIRQDVGSPKFFFQSAGTLTIDAATPPLSDPISMHWSGLTLVEVNIDLNTFQSTPVPGGACYSVLINTVFRDGFGG